MSNWAFFYIMNKDSYLAEARVSGESIMKAMPDADIFAFSNIFNTTPITYPFKGCVPLPNIDGNNWFLKQTGFMPTILEWLNSRGYEKVCFMDCDTYVCEPVYELFNMLDVFDIMGAHAPARQTTGSYFKLPMSFPEFNIGVNPMRCNTAMQIFWHSAYNLFRSNQEIYGKNDQGALRDTLWNLKPHYSFYVLPPEYNLRFVFPCFVAGRVKILHGHGASQEIADQINANEGMRVWYQNQLFTQ